MGQLRDVLSRAGFGNVRTYVQSGNACVDSGLSADKVRNCVHRADKKEYRAGPGGRGEDRPRAAKRYSMKIPSGRVMTNSRVFFLLFAQPPPAENVRELTAQDFGGEKLAFTRTKDAAFMYIPGPYGRGRLSGNYLEKKLGVSGTMRNFNTMHKLVEMSNDGT